LQKRKLMDYLLAKPGSQPGYPFGPGTLVFKVGGRMFALLAEDSRPWMINLKCDPDDALALRAAYPAITPGYHMNKRYWNTLTLDGSVPDPLVRELIDQSYELVIRGLSKVERQKVQKKK
jgi:predicted DNA-binding protein (MmcQ/YjbR family)